MFERQYMAMSVNLNAVHDEWHVARTALYDLEEQRASGQSDLDQQINELNVKEKELRLAFKEVAANAPDYRLAQQWYEVSDIADVTSEQTLKVAMVAFGVFSFLLTFAGMFFATVSLVIRR